MPLALSVDRLKWVDQTQSLWRSMVSSRRLRSWRVRTVAANLLGLAQPIAGLNLEVTANVNYSVLDHGTENPYFQSTVMTPYTAQFNSAFLATERLRVANESAIRTNIERFIQELTEFSRANPPAPPST